MAAPDYADNELADRAIHALYARIAHLEVENARLKAHLRVLQAALSHIGPHLSTVAERLSHHLIIPRGDGAAEPETEPGEDGVHDSRES